MPMYVPEDFENQHQNKVFLNLCFRKENPQSLRLAHLVCLKHVSELKLLLRRPFKTKGNKNGPLTTRPWQMFFYAAKQTNASLKPEQKREKACKWK